MIWLTLFLVSTAATGGLFLGGFLRASKEYELLDIGFDRGYKAGCNEERSRARQAIYDAWDDGYEKGFVMGSSETNKGVQA